MPTITTNDIKNGMALDIEGVLFEIVEFQHVKPGKGGAFVRTTLKNARNGAVIHSSKPTSFALHSLQFLAGHHRYLELTLIVLKANLHIQVAPAENLENRIPTSLLC